MKHVEDVSLRWNAILKRQLDGGKDGLFIVLQHQGEDVDHFTVATGSFEQMGQQLPERRRQLDERGAIAQGAGLALDHGEIMTPIIDRSPWQMVRSLDDPGVLAENLPLGRHDDPCWVDSTLTGRLAKEAGTL